MNDSSKLTDDQRAWHELVACVDAAADNDAAWFDGHCHRLHRARPAEICEVMAAAVATGTPALIEPGCEWIALMKLGQRGIIRLLVRSCAADPCDLDEAALARLWQRTAPPDLDHRGGVSVIA